jgi:hypothetical protein
MSAHHILGAEAGSKGSAVRRLKWYVKLGLERRETVRSLSTVTVKLATLWPSYERIGLSALKVFRLSFRYAW